jgi:hypothetical protein
MISKTTVRLHNFLSEKLRAFPYRSIKLFVQISSVLLSVFVIYQFIPKSLFNNLPATGGDTGSHFWPVKVLHDYGIPNWVARPWNPGNNGGEGLLVHYFPLPFLFMALLSYIVPVGLAFNIGTILPVVTLPLSVWLSMRLMSMRVSASILSAIFASAVVLNEGYSMWGGNTLSTLAGQFAHMYAQNFLLLGMGVLWRELNNKQLPWKSGLLFAAVALSHGYIYFGIPPLLFLVLIFHPKYTFRYRTFICFTSALISLLLSLWFIGPMVMNNAWVTPHSFSWAFQNWVEEVLPKIFEPLIFAFVVATIAIAYRKMSPRDFKLIRVTLFWFFSGLVYLGFFFLFRWLKLVDVRAIPQTQLFWAITSGCVTGLALQPLQKRFQLLISMLLVIAMYFWETGHVVKFPIWMEWNYSGWQSKSNYKELMLLSDGLRGDLSQPRVAYEHHLKNNFVGTERVFEMLPYFANRATTESLYLQSTPIAPMIYSLTSEISENASCPFSNWPCMRFGLLQSEGRQELMGVQQLILSSNIALSAAASAPFLKSKFTFGPWTVYENKKPIPMVETFSVKPELIPFDDWRVKFWDWFRVFQKGKPFLITAEKETQLPSESSWVANKECHPSTTVDFSGIYLKTDCPGVAHYLKYAYNPSFTSSNGEPIFLVSPGFLGIVPNTNELKLTYGSSRMWVLSRWASIIFACILGFLILGNKNFFSKLASSYPFHNPTQSPKTNDKNSKKRKVNPKSQTTETKRGKKPFIFVAALFFILYLAISLHTDALLFWNWRKLNFRDFELIDYNQGYGVLHKNEDLDGRPIVLKGTIYYSGLATHANSEIRIRIKSSDPTFLGTCGYPDYANGANIVCEIRSQGRTLFTSAPLNGNNREQRFRVPIRPDQELSLVVRSLRPDITAAHAVWVDLKTLSK